MSISSDNIVTRNLHGKFGNQVVFRVRHGQSIMAVLPHYNQKGPIGGQARVRREFKLAAAWAREAIADPELKAAYKAQAPGRMTAFAMAMTNYLRAPRVTLIDVSGYTGQEGEQIGVTAIDFFRIVGVKVTIVSPSGEILEEGECSLGETENGWVYVAQRPLSVLPGMLVLAVAINLPQKRAELSVTL
jgi:hypothetical protein